MRSSGAIILLKHYDVCFLHPSQGIVIPISAGQRGPPTLKSKCLPSPLTAGLGDEAEKIVLHAGKHNGICCLETIIFTLLSSKAVVQEFRVCI